MPVLLFALFHVFLYSEAVDGRLEEIMSKFFSYEERLHLQGYLKDGFSFKEISRRLGKDPSTISREIRKYSCEVALIIRKKSA